MLRSFARRLLRAWDGIGRPKAARASDPMRRAHMQQPETLFGKPIRYTDDLGPLHVSENEQASPWRTDDYLLSHMLYGGQSISEWLNDFRDDCQRYADLQQPEPPEHPSCRSVGMPSEVVVPDTFPEDWRRE